MTTSRLTPEAIVLLNRLGADPNFAMFRSQAGFSPSDKIDQPQLGDYLDSLAGASGADGFFGFTTPANPLAKADPTSDEFDLKALDAKWLRLPGITKDPLPPQRGATFGAPGTQRESLSLRSGWLLLQPPYDNATPQQSGVYQAVDATTPALYSTRFSVDSNVAHVGDEFTLSLCQHTSGVADLNNRAKLALTRVDSNDSWHLTYSTWASGSETDVYSVNLSSFSQPLNGLAIQHDPSTSSFAGYAFSDSGGWKFLGTASLPMLAVTRAFLGCSSQDAPNTIYGVDYFRRQPGLLVTL